MTAAEVTVGTTNKKENDLPKELVGMGQQALTLILKLI
jgi:hypothetical protein